MKSVCSPYQLFIHCFQFATANEVTTPLFYSDLIVFSYLVTGWSVAFSEWRKVLSTLFYHQSVTDSHNSLLLMLSPSLYWSIMLPSERAPQPGKQLYQYLTMVSLHTQYFSRVDLGRWFGGWSTPSPLPPNFYHEHARKLVEAVVLMQRPLLWDVYSLNQECPLLCNVWHWCPKHFGGRASPRRVNQKQPLLWDVQHLCPRYFGGRASPSGFDEERPLLRDIQHLCQGTYFGGRVSHGSFNQECPLFRDEQHLCSGTLVTEHLISSFKWKHPPVWDGEGAFLRGADC